MGDGGAATSCELNFPYATAIDASGNLYIADQGNNRVRKVNTAGIITTIAGTGVLGYGGDDSAATNAKLYSPSGVAVDGSGNVYIGDNGNHRIRKVNAAGIITTVAGTGATGYNGDGIAATAATLFSPHEVAVDTDGNLYISDVLNFRIRKVDASGIISTVAGKGTFMTYGGDNGAATATDIGDPYDLVVDATGNIIFATPDYHRVCKINPAGIITTVAGTGMAGYNGDNIPATMAQLRNPFGVAVDGGGNVYIGDYYNNRVRKVNSSGIITTYAGTDSAGFSGDGGPATMAQLHGPIDVTTDGAGNLYVTEWANFTVRYIRSTVAVKEINKPKGSISVYPNPSNNGRFTIDLVLNAEHERRIVIYDLAGRVVKNIVADGLSSVDIDLGIANGIYILEVITPEEILREKIVVQRE